MEVIEIVESGGVTVLEVEPPTEVFTIIDSQSTIAINEAEETVVIESLGGAQGVPGPQGIQGDQGETRYLIEDAAGYPDRPIPTGEPVTYVGTTNPDTLGIMIVGDSWINLDATGNIDEFRGPIGVGIEAIIQAGNLIQKNNVMPPGQRIAVDCTMQEIHIRIGTAPVGQDAIMRVNYTRGASTTVLGTYTITQGTNTASFTGLNWALLAGDIITYDVTQTGSTTIGADLAVQLVGTGG